MTIIHLIYYAVGVSKLLHIHRGTIAQYVKVFSAGKYGQTIS